MKLAIPRRFATLGVLTAATTLLLAPVAGLPTGAQASETEIPRINLRANSSFAQGEALSAPQRFLSEELERLSNGRITVENYYAGALFSAGTEPEAMASGVADIATFVTVWHRGTFPVLGDGWCLPFALDNAMMADAQQIPEMGDILQEDFARLGMIALLGGPAPQSWHFATPLPNGIVPADMTTVFDGLRVRGYGVYPDVIRAFGGTAVAFPSPEIPVALRTGQMDGFVTSYDTWFNLGVHEDSPYTYHVPDLTCGSQVVINQATWDGFSPAVQELFLEAAAIATKRSYDNAMEEKERILKAAEDNPRITVHHLTAEEQDQWIEAIQPFWDEFASRGDAQRRWVEAARKFRAEGYTPSWER
jgi:TRAP-type C4-dicarboxylate transport system substrate-binding protein